MCLNVFGTAMGKEGVWNERVVNFEYVRCFSLFCLLCKGDLVKRSGGLLQVPVRTRIDDPNLMLRPSNFPVIALRGCVGPNLMHRPSNFPVIALKGSSTMITRDSSKGSA
jgi:hypothetical protein